MCIFHLLIIIPLLCTPVDRQAWYLATWGTPIAEMHLHSFGAPTAGTYTEPFVEGASQRGQTVMLSTLIEYAVTTYGRERLPILVRNLRQYNSWETLLPAVYGVPAAEFEAGWVEYLAAYYDPDLPTFLIDKEEPDAKSNPSAPSTARYGAHH